MPSLRIPSTRDALAAAAALILLTLPIGALAAVDIDPGTTASDLAADGGTTVEVCTNTGTETCTVVVNVAENEVGALVDATADTAGVAIGEVFTDFTITGTDEVPLVGSFLSGTVAVDGVLSTLGPGAFASVEASLQVTDTTDGILVGAQKVVDESISDGSVRVLEMSPVAMPLPLTRGHSYRISLIIGARAAGNLADAATALSDFINTASWSDLSVTAGQDPFGPIAALEARVTQVEEDVAELSDDLDALEGRVDVVEVDLDALEETVAELREDFDNHTHTYLTGKGVGHNNTEATTTLPGEDEPTPEPKNNGNGVGPAIDEAPSDGEDDSRPGRRVRRGRR